MNKYQLAVLNNEESKTFYSCTSQKTCCVLSDNFNYDNDTYVLNQDEDIFSTQYEFVIKTNSNIESCTCFVNGEWQNASKKGTAFSVMLDFECRVEKIKLVFADGIVDEYIFSIQYVETDKEAYYQKQAENTRKAYIEAAQIKHSTGADLANIYFQPCCNDYKRTEIELWIADGKFAPRHGMCVTFYTPQLTGGEAKQMIAKFNIEDGMLFKAINGLAVGVYAYKVRQFNKNDEMLFESDFAFFNIISTVGKGPIPRVNR